MVHHCGSLGIKLGDPLANHFLIFARMIVFARLRLGSRGFVWYATQLRSELTIDRQRPAPVAAV